MGGSRIHHNLGAEQSLFCQDISCEKRPLYPDRLGAEISADHFI